MKKIESFIFLSICEITVKNYKKTNYLTYINYCNLFRVSINDKSLSAKETQQLISILDYLKKIYGLTDVESIDYILKFLESDNILDYQRCVEMMEVFYPKSFN
jgi:hypothetical protein